MSILDWFKRRNQKENQQVEPVISPVQTKNMKEGVNFTRPITAEEKELVSLIAGVVASEHDSGKYFYIQNISGIDTEKEIVSAVVGAVATNDNPNTKFKITKIDRVN